MDENTLAGRPGGGLLGAKARAHREAIRIYTDALIAERAAVVARMEGLHRLRLTTLDLAADLRRALDREYPPDAGERPMPVRDLLEWVVRLETMAKRATLEATDLVGLGSALEKRLDAPEFTNLLREVPQMTATETLKHEHRVIEMVLGAVDREVRRAARGEAVDPAFFAQAIDFIRHFADKCHHGKEEGILFKRMNEKGIPVDGGPIGVMLAEHEEGRQYVRAAGTALDRGDLQATAGELGKYTALLRQHIMKEDRILYPMAERVIGESELKDMVKRFEAVERDEMGQGTHERYHELAHALAGEPVQN